MLTLTSRDSGCGLCLATVLPPHGFRDDLICPVRARLGWTASLTQRNPLGACPQDGSNGLLIADDAFEGCGRGALPRSGRISPWLHDSTLRRAAQSRLNDQ